jgi:asparagine synthetase A
MRYISFDNKFTSEVSEIVEDPSSYLRYALISFLDSDISAYTYMPSISRDIDEEKGETMVTNNFFIEYRLIESQNISNIVVSLATNIFSIINDINTNHLFKDIQKPFYMGQKTNIVEIEKIKKLFPTLPLKEGLTEYVITHGPTLIIGSHKILPDDKRLEFGTPTNEDYNNTSILYVFSESINRVLPIIKIAPRPTLEIIKEQLIIDAPGDLDHQIYQETILDKNKNFPLSVGIKIYFSNLMLINLNKLHLCEVVHSPYSSELHKYFVENNIEVL